MCWPWLGSAASQAPRQPQPAPCGVFVPPLSSAAPGVAAPSFHDPRLAPLPAVGATGWSSAPFQPPRFSSAPLGTPRDSESEDSDSGSSSASAALDSAATQLADLIYDFCPEAKPVSDSAPPPRCGFESWFDPSPTLSLLASLPHLPSGCGGGVRGRRSLGCPPPALQTFVGGFATQGPPFCGCGSAAFCGPAACESVILPSCGRCGRGVQALGLHHVCGDGEAGEVIPMSAGGLRPSG